MPTWNELDSVMGSLETEIHEQIDELQEYQTHIVHNKNLYINWELTYNRIELVIDKLYRQRKVARILEN